MTKGGPPAREAVRKAWAQERKLVMRTGRGTREWTVAQKRELIETGRVKGFEGHHINNVASNDRAMARNPNNISFKEGRAEHLDAHAGNFASSTSGPLLSRLGAAALAFGLTYEAKMQELADQSPLVSDPKSGWSWVNPFNYLVEPVAVLSGVVAAASSKDDK